MCCEKEAPRRVPIHVLTCGVADGCMEGTLPLSTYSKRAYAHSRGYTFAADAEAMEDKPRIRYTVWGKMNIVQKHLPRSGGWLVWMDLDVVVMNWRTRVEDIIARYPHSAEIIVGQPTGDPTFNTGIYIVRKSEWTASFFEQVQKRSDLYNVWPYEQQAMWETAQKHIGTKIFIEKDDQVMGSLCGYGDGSCRWKAGNWTLHMAPPLCPRELVMEAAYQSMLALPDPYAPILVTPATPSEVRMLLRMLDTVQQTNPGLRVLVYDMGLSTRDIAMCEAHSAVRRIARLRPAAKHLLRSVPRPHKRMALQSAIVEDALLHHDLIAWIQPYAAVTGSLRPFWSHTIESGVAAPESDWTASITPIHKLHAGPQPESAVRSLCGNILVGMTRHHPSYVSIIQPWLRCQRLASCTTPTSAAPQGVRLDEYFLSSYMFASGLSCSVWPSAPVNAKTPDSREQLIGALPDPSNASATHVLPSSQDDCKEDTVGMPISPSRTLPTIVTMIFGDRSQSHPSLDTTTQVGTDGPPIAVRQARVLTLKNPMVVWTVPGLVDQVRLLRHELDLDAMTLILELPAAAAAAGAPTSSLVTSKECMPLAQSAAVALGSLGLVAAVAASNPFFTFHFIWLDGTLSDTTFPQHFMHSTLPSTAESMQRLMDLGGVYLPSVRMQGDGEVTAVSSVWAASLEGANWFNRTLATLEHAEVSDTDAGRHLCPHKLFLRVAASHVDKISVYVAPTGLQDLLTSF